MLEPYNRNEIYMTQKCWDNLHSNCDGVFINGKCGCLCHSLPRLYPKKTTKIDKGD